MKKNIKLQNAGINIIRLVLIISIFIITYGLLKTLSDNIIFLIIGLNSLSDESMRNIDAIKTLIQIPWLYLGYKAGAFIWRKTNHWITPLKKNS